MFGRMLACCMLCFAMRMACAQSKDAAALIERLQRAEAESSIDVNDQAPWHLKLDVHLFTDKDQKTGQQGTIEEWWAGDKARRVVYTMPTFTATELTNASGTYVSKDLVPVELSNLLDQVVHPIPHEEIAAPSKPKVLMQKAGSVSLECVMLSQPLKETGIAPLGLFPTYCFNPGQDTLRESVEFGRQVTVRNSVGQFRTHKVATDIAISSQELLVAQARVTALSGIQPEAAMFDDVSGLSPVAPSTEETTPIVLAASAINKVPMVYPPFDRAKRIQGKVVLKGLIARDGHMRQLRIEEAPDGSLALAAITAVRQWTYKPFLLNGLPTEVESTITVNFNLSQ